MSMKNTDKSQRAHIRIILYIVAVITVAMIIETLILNSLNKKSSYKTALVLLNQVSSIIEDDIDSEDEMIESLKEEFVIRAQVVSYILDARPDAETDIDELKKIAKMMQIDEIHIFDETGTIYAGTEPQYYGFNFNSGEQMQFFTPMLTDKTLTMCQDITPNTAEGKSMMYAICWNETGDKMIQVGIEPLRLMDELQNNEMSQVIAKIPTYDGFEILVADADTWIICGSTNPDLMDVKLDEIGITRASTITGRVLSDTMHFKGDKYSCNLVKADNYIVVVSYSAGSAFENVSVAITIEFIYLILACITIIFMFSRLMKSNTEKNTQMAVLASMSDIYNSMHLLDLVNNTVVEYHARTEISEAVKNTLDADEMMRQMTDMSVADEYLESALEFTDTHTLSDRMQDKKIISEVFTSKAIGWFRASFITIDKDWSGHPTRVVFVTQNIDKEKKKEEELLIKSNVDELTGLYNRRAFEDSIAEYGDTVTEPDFVFISLDVNGLKVVNDSMGHAAGDELLKGAATCMKRCFGPYGRIYRIGGDEFAATIFANDTQLDKIKQDFEEIMASWSGEIVKSLSISSGYVPKRDVSTTSIHEMSHIADMKMYEAKARHYMENPEQDRRKRRRDDSANNVSGTNDSSANNNGADANNSSANNSTDTDNNSSTNNSTATNNNSSTSAS